VSDSVATTGIPTHFVGVTVGATNDQVRLGFAGGGGAEWAFAASMSAKIEYLYYHLSDDTVLLNYNVLPSGAGTFVNYRFRNEGHIVRLGVNFKFGQ
jgi:outer membrane immunogenic protein